MRVSQGTAAGKRPLDFIHPLSIVDFILNILLPEASIRLIVQDKGWNGGEPMQSSAWDAPWRDADQVRCSSAPFGNVRRRADNKECQSILEEVHNRDMNTRKLVMEMRGDVAG